MILAYVYIPTYTVQHKYKYMCIIENMLHQHLTKKVDTFKFALTVFEKTEFFNNKIFNII